MDPERTPVIVGVGQAVARPGDEPVPPLALVERASRAAFDEAPGLARHVDRVSVVNVLNGGGRAPATLLARRLGLTPADAETTTIGGNSPQWLVTRAAADIAASGGPTTLIAGGEAVRSQREAPDIGRDAEDVDRADDVVGDDRPGLGSAELDAGLVAPAHVYPMFESVVAQRAGRGYAEHREHLGWLMAPFTAVAAKHPFSWFQEELAPEELATPSPDNRLVAEPYTKRMTAHLVVDQAAAILVTSLQVARDLRFAGHCVFVHSGADVDDVWFPSERPDLGSSPGMRVAGRAALDAADVSVDDIVAFDLYSCFPVTVEMALEALGVPEDDRRPSTVTGGLPYFGGPGSNYTTHGIATMVDHLREEGGRGLVSGLGWFATKHSYGVYGVAPPERGFRVGETHLAQRDIDASALTAVPDVEGAVAATVAASTVVHERTGEPRGAPVIATLDDGRRVVADADRSELAALEGVNLVDALVRIEGRQGRRGGPLRYRVEEAASPLGRAGER